LRDAETSAATPQCQRRRRARSACRPCRFRSTICRWRRALLLGYFALSGPNRRDFDLLDGGCGGGEERRCYSPENGVGGDGVRRWEGCGGPDGARQRPRSPTLPLLLACVPVQPLRANNTGSTDERNGPRPW